MGEETTVKWGGEGGSSELPPLGSHRAVIAEVLDKGMVYSALYKKHQRQLVIIAQLQQRKAVGTEFERRHEVWYWVTFSGGKKAKLFKLVSGIFRDQLPAEGSVEWLQSNLPGKPVMADVEPKVGGKEGIITTLKPYYGDDPLALDSSYTPVAQRQRNEGSQQQSDGNQAPPSDDDDIPF